MYVKEKEKEYESVEKFAYAKDGLGNIFIKKEYIYNVFHVSIFALD